MTSPSRFSPFELDAHFTIPTEKRDFVIKVKYGDTLRRFVAQVHGQFMDHTLSSLRAKIINLFKFSPDAVLILTYTDEDGDSVTLNEDEELHDAAITQRLNPLRINVQLKTRGSPDPISQTDNLNLSQQIEASLFANPAVAEALKSVPEPLRAVVSKVSQDVLLKASSVPPLAQLIEGFSKSGLYNGSFPSDGRVGGSSGSSSGPSNSPDVNATDVPNSGIYPSPETVQMTDIGSPDRENISKQNMANTTRGLIVASPKPVDLNMDPLRNQHESEPASYDDLLTTQVRTLLTMIDEEDKKKGGDTPGGKSSVMSRSAPAEQPETDNSQNYAVPNLLTTQVRTLLTMMDKEDKMGGGDVPSGKSSVISRSAPAGRSEAQNSQNSAVPNPSLSPPNKVDTSEVPAEDTNKQRRTLPTDRVPSQMLSHSYSTPASNAHTFHRGVQCDGCGMYPIMGPRFKSIVKEDYDLCRYCFYSMGIEADYTRIDRPLSQCPFLLGSLKPQVRCGGLSVLPPKLESLFVKDVTVIDGTVLPPCTPFTKIWRMRNNGTVSWPFGTHLLRTGGNPLGFRNSVRIEVPFNGYPAGQEIDIAVDFTSPLEVGNYTSFWRLATSSGKTFGQRIWVQIKVENPPQKKSEVEKPETNFVAAVHAGLNLNLPAELREQDVVGIIDMNAVPSDDDFTRTNFPGPWDMPYSPLKTGPKMDSLSGASDAQVVPQDEVPELHVFQEPTSKVTATFDMPASEGVTVDIPLSEAATVDMHMEWALLKMLEEMGFLQLDLNKEVLRKNDYNLEKAVDELCDFAEWDPLLTELQGMGFNDKVRNKKLLVKNGGSIKRVVLDLISGEKDTGY